MGDAPQSPYCQEETGPLGQYSMCSIPLSQGFLMHYRVQQVALLVCQVSRQCPWKL